jgi:DNA (cytosine-5)-methyltransferase 3A
MNEESKQVISECLGCEPIFIDSNCFSAQDRPRYYWTNIPVQVTGLKECSLCLRDVLEDDVDQKYFYNYPLSNIDLTKQVCATMEHNNHEMHKRVFNPAFKCHTLTAVCGGNQQKKVYIDGRARKLTPIEYERLQTLPDNYTQGVCDGARYKAIGNGWTVDVIAYILSFI